MHLYNNYNYDYNPWRNYYGYWGPMSPQQAYWNQQQSLWEMNVFTQWNTWSQNQLNTGLDSALGYMDTYTPGYGWNPYGNNPYRPLYWYQGY
ncbi:MAG: hypothetical protein HYU64_04285 [Armatimonadetes bacterium]|nr:hypothetical protein [Armatimonadota bacterium]